MEISVALGVRKGAWTKEEDKLLKKCIEENGVGKWHQVPSRAGLNRCRKSCRLRWLNYLRPNIKRGNFTPDEVDLIIRLHKLLGNRWSLIAGRLCGRTSNEIKNYWNTYLHKKLVCQKNEGDKLTTEKNVKTKIFRPKPRTFNNNILISTVNNLNSDNLAPIGDTHSNPSSISSLNMDNEKPWWDNMSLDSIKDPINEEIGTSRLRIDDISYEGGYHMSDWANIFRESVDIGDFSNGDHTWF